MSAFGMVRVPTQLFTTESLCCLAVVDGGDGEGDINSVDV